jgi:5'-nucleotidase
MTTSRRLFLAQASLVAGATVLTKHLRSANPAGILTRTIDSGNDALTIYHTNNLNGQIGPVYKNFGGLNQVKLHMGNKTRTGLLLDAGGFTNKSDSFEQQKNIVGVMNDAGYKAAAISGLDFSGSTHRLAELVSHMKFQLINCNHRLNKELQSLIKPYTVVRAGTVKIGITGVSAPLNGAVYFDAIECANRTARFLKHNEGCHLVICLSDIGFNKGGNELSDQKLAAESEHIDIIIGRDRGNFLGNNVVLHNKLKQEVVFSAAVGKGLMPGKAVVCFDDDRKKKRFTVEHVIAGKPDDKSFAAAFRELQSAGADRLLS